MESRAGAPHLDSRDTSGRKRVTVVGGGVAGLTAAWRLAKDPRVQVTLYEQEDRLGGVLRTERIGDYLVELSADMFTTKDPWALELCRELDLEDMLVGANESKRKAFVVRKGTLHQVPQGFVLMRPTQLRAMVSTPLLSWRGKLRMFCEPFVRPRKTDEDESLQSFVSRRLGKEVFQRIVQPLVGGIYTADPTQLSMLAAMPAFVDMERRYGSLIRAPHGKGEESASGARYGAFVAPREGMQAITDALEQRLDHVSVRLSTQVNAIVREGSTWRIETHEGADSSDAVILAVAAPVAGKILANISPDLSDAIESIPYASAAVAIFGCRRADIQRPVDGFGFVVPAIENRRILAASFASHKFPDRAPDDRVLMRVFLGGACQSEILQNDDMELLRIALEELAELIGYQGQPDFKKLVRWNRAMPQYHLGHLQKVDRIEAGLRKEPGLALAGNAYRGVGVPFCIRSGNEAAAQVLEQLFPP